MPVFVDELRDGFSQANEQDEKEVSHETLVSCFDARVVGVDTRRCAGPEGRGEGMESTAHGVWPAGPAGNMELFHAHPAGTTR
jgi:hypothetical protein